MIVEYNKEEVYTNKLDLENAGFTCIHFISDNDNEYFLLTKTIEGKLSILTLGPIIGDLGIPVDGFSTYYKQTEYKNKTIENEISKFLNDKKKGKSKLVEEINLSDAYSQIPNIIELFKNLV